MLLFFLAVDKLCAQFTFCWKNAWKTKEVEFKYIIHREQSLKAAGIAALRVGWVLKHAKKRGRKWC